MQQKVCVLVAEAPAAGEGELELTDVSSITTLLPTIAMVNPDVVVLDLELAGSDVVDAVRRVHRSAPKVPLIVLADSRDKEEAARCLEAGAIDYLLKGLMDGQTVQRAVRTALERNTLDGLADLMRDPSTSLYTRDGLMTLGRRAMEAAQKCGGTLVLLCALVENLAKLRDAVGQGAAEQAASEVAQLLRGSFRRTDIVARIGEAQFAALAVDAAAPSGPVLLQRVHRRLDTLNQLRGEEGRVRVRMAASFWGPHESRTFAELLDGVESELRGNPMAAGERDEQRAGVAWR